MGNDGFQQGIPDTRELKAVSRQSRSYLGDREKSKNSSADGRMETLDDFSRGGEPERLGSAHLRARHFQEY